MKIYIVISHIVRPCQYQRDLHVRILKILAYGRPEVERGEGWPNLPAGARTPPTPQIVGLDEACVEDKIMAGYRASRAPQAFGA